MGRTLEKRGLLPRQHRFVMLVAADVPPQTAAHQAGYKGRPGQLGKRARKLMAHPEIADAISAERDRLRNALNITSREVIQGYVDIARADITEALINETGVPNTLAEIRALPKALRMAIQSIKVDAGEITIKMEPKVQALHSLSRVFELEGSESVQNKPPAPEARRADPRVGLLEFLTRIEARSNPGDD